MTPIHTDQGRKEESKSASPDQHSWFPIGGIRDICAICGSKQGDLREEKALAGFGLIGHSGNHIQSALSIPFARPSLTP